MYDNIDAYQEGKVKTDKLFKLWVLLLRTKDLMYKLRDRELQEAVNISPAMSGILCHSRVLGDKATPTEISRWLHQEPHNISQIVSSMANKGLVRKVRDLHRKNLVRVELTEKGQQAYNHVIKAITVHRILSALSKEEQHQLASCLEKVRSKCLEEADFPVRPHWPFSRLP